MSKSKQLLLAGLSLFTMLLVGCSKTPTLSQEEAQSKTENFLESVVENIDLAYADTSTRFQENTNLEEFKTVVSNNSLQEYSSFTLTEIAYQQGVGINAAKADGTVNFTSGTVKEASFIWSYDATKQDWFLDAFRFE